MYLPVNGIQFITVFISIMYMYTGASSELGKSTKDTVNPLYHTSTITDNHKKEVLKHVINKACV